MVFIIIDIGELLFFIAFWAYLLTSRLLLSLNLEEHSLKCFNWLVNIILFFILILFIAFILLFLYYIFLMVVLKRWLILSI